MFILNLMFWWELLHGRFGKAFLIMLAKDEVKTETERSYYVGKMSERNSDSLYRDSWDYDD